jgi:hypothetical protein
VATEEFERAALAVVAVFAAHTLSVAFLPSQQTPTARARHVAAARTATEQTAAQLPRNDLDLVAYEGLGSWVDLFDRGPWKNPSWSVGKMYRRGVRTLYLQTATYGSPSHIVYPHKVAEYIASAHRRNMTVVGWSVPSFTKWRKDLRRARAGLRFETGAGERFDSFALDIEANIIERIPTRNKRLLKISTKLRAAAGPDYPLGAIIPDTHSNYWPDFPYRDLAAIYDVMVPMGYFTFATHGYRNVRDYTERNIRVIRKHAGAKTPIHVIGGIADDVGVPAARGFVRAIRRHGVLGASLYDFPITSEESWAELSRVRRPTARKP